LARRLLKRFLREARSQPSHLEGLADALRDLLQAGSTGDPFFLLHSMELLVRNLGASQATLVIVTDPEVETRWWYPELPDEEPPAPVTPLCTWLLEHPDRTLVAKDLREGAPYKDRPEFKALPYGAALGNALVQGGTVKALLFVFFVEARDFTRTDFVLLDAVAGFMGRVLEIEDLKVSLNRMEDALAITRAVMEDSSIRDGQTDLPNRRYLDIWKKALVSSGNRPESLVLAEFQMEVHSRADVARLHKAAEGVRAGDLVVRLSSDRFLVVFQHTPRALAHILLLRVRTQLGSVPMGATLWLPGTEGEDLEPANGRLQTAFNASRQQPDHALVWHLPESIKEGQRPGTANLKAGQLQPQPWQPALLEIPASDTRGSMKLGRAKVSRVPPGNPKPGER